MMAAKHYDKIIHPPLPASRILPSAVSAAPKHQVRPNHHNPAPVASESSPHHHSKIRQRAGIRPEGNAHELHKLAHRVQQTKAS